jgi:general secretion pathway protein I
MMLAKRPACRVAAGFTLVEVLVALAVVVIAFIAMYGSAQQIVSSTTLQQEKTFASWVAFDQLTTLRLEAQLPSGDRMSGETEMAGREWRYVVEFNSVDSSYIRQAVVRVSPAEEPDRVLAVSLGVLQTQPAAAGTSGAALVSSTNTLGNGSDAGSNGGSESDRDSGGKSGDHDGDEVSQ